MSTLNNGKAQPLLKAGVLVGPLFVGLSLILALANSGFDITKHEVSLLLVGNLGWIQMINFILVGLLSIACAFGLKQSLKSGKGSKWGPILLGAFGIFFIIAGFFHPDPQLGFPIGAPVDVPIPASAHANIHSLAFTLLALSVVANGFVLARRYLAKRRAWGIYSIANSIAILVFVAIGSSQMANGHGGLALLGAAITITFWVSVVALQAARE